MEKAIWHNLTPEKVLKKLESNQKGLSPSQVKERFKKYGPNKLPEKKRFSIVQIIIEQFKSPLMYVLVIAALIALSIGETTDMIIILGAVFINVAIGFFQEFKAEETFSHLKKMVKHKAKVVRRSQTGKSNIFTVLTREVVPGDIISVEAGDIVAADARILHENNLETKEAALTGESIPSSKQTKILDKETNLADRENMIYAGTLVTRGSGKAVVVNTGKDTEIGKIAHMIKTTKEDKTPLQKKITKLAKVLGVIIAILCVALFGIGLLLGFDYFEMFLVSIAVAVAGIPEGLPIAVTVALAVGMQAILKKKALVKKLIATETLGSITVIASDKTGTLTRGEMAVSDILPFNDTISETELLRSAMLCNNTSLENPDKKDGQAWKLTGSPTEVALFQKGLESKIDSEKLFQKNKRIAEIPFESEIMYMATLYKTNTKDKHNLIVKGAPEKIIKLSNLKEKQKKDLLNQIKKLTKKGLRVLAFGEKEIKIKDSKDIHIEHKDTKDLNFKGLIALKDPLRSDAKDTIDACIKAGIRPIIITGDHKLTARSIGKEVGLIHSESEILQGNQIDKLSDKELQEKLKTTSIFARVEPKHKIRIVDALQKQGETVAMAGDGVNDAPALKSANIGVALGSGSEVTKGTAEMVLLDDRFQTIVDAVKQGRNIFHNIKKIVLFLLSDTFTEFILIAGSLLLGLPIPLLAAQILWVNIIEDTMPAIALSYEKEEEELLKQTDDERSHKILDKEMKILIGIVGIVTDVILVALYYYLYKSGFNMEYIRTMLFVALGIDTLFYVLACKNLKKAIWHYNPFNNKFLNFSIVFGWIMFFVALYIPFFERLLEVVPLNVHDWFILLTLGILKLILIEFGKSFFLIEKDNK